MVAIRRALRWRALLTASVLASAPATAGDLDGDGLADDRDNCVSIANGPTETDSGGLVQYDADGDGFGNRCDADYDQDGRVDERDFRHFRRCHLTPRSARAPPESCNVADHDGSGRVDAPDFWIFRELASAREPGPSGLACADPRRREVCRGARNLLLIIGDDTGVDLLGTYAHLIPEQPPPGLDGVAPAPTPTLDLLAREGVTFTKAWSNPVCGATRGTLMTGRYGIRLAPVVAFLGRVPTGTPTVATALGDAGYDTAAFGKWGVNDGSLGFFKNLGPELAGFDHFAGFVDTVLPSKDYYHWWKNEWTAGTPFDAGWSDVYATSDNVDDAIAWIDAREAMQPWFVWLSPYSAHTPFHDPDQQGRLSHFDLSGVDCSGSLMEKRTCVLAAVEAFDSEIGRLLESLDPAVRARTTVIFVGDNGTVDDISVAPFDAAQSKGTLYESGINVPLIVSGAGVVAPGRVSGALVNTTDIFATAVELAGAGLAPSQTAPDSVSFAPVLDGSCPSGDCGNLRSHVYSELRVAEEFELYPGMTIALCAGSAPTNGRTVRNREGYKLIRFRQVFHPSCTPVPGKPDEFYFVGGDNPFAVESDANRIEIGSWPGEAARAAFEELSALLPADEETPPSL